MIRVAQLGKKNGALEFSQEQWDVCSVQVVPDVEYQFRRFLAKRSLGDLSFEAFRNFKCDFMRVFFKLRPAGSLAAVYSHLHTLCLLGGGT